MPGSNTNQVPPGGSAPRSRVKRRILLVLAVEFATVMAVATIEGFWPSAGPGSGLALIFLFGCAAIVPVAMAVLTRPLLREVVGLEDENRRLQELYGRARLDSLLDGLTGLGNHRAFQEELVRQLEGSRRNNASLALLLVDVDDLKSVNDQGGHAAGDELLVNVGKTIVLSLRRPDRAFRVGGDEFAIMLPGADLDTGYAVARRILASALEGGDPTRPTDPVSLSIGVSAYPAPSTRADHLYQHADAALYWCKRHGRTTAAAYDPSRHGVSPDDRSDEDLSAAIGKVLAEKLLRPVYQPIFSLASGDPIGYEGLIRPTEGSMIPDATTLFAAAGRADRTVELDMACLEAIAQGVGVLEPGIYLSVNLSPRTLESDLFHPVELTDIFARRGISPDQLVVELTEREEVQDLPTLRRNATACRKAGIRLAADDVGSGNAGLRLLNEIHFDIVKIDLSLVQGGIHHDPSHGVLRALQELATRWSATIVAEGVETGEQLAAIRELGLTAGQGYLLGRPSPERRAERLDLENLIPRDWLHKVGSPAA